MILSDFLSRHTHDNSNRHDIIIISFNMQHTLHERYYKIETKESQLHTALRKVMITYIGPVVIYKIIDPHNYLLMTLYGKILGGLFEYERLKPAILRTNEENVNNLSQLK